jgi:cupin 2 domain-containing protein
MNLFTGIPADLPQELVQTLATSGQVRIERIVSRGHASPSGFWYDQDEHEWVVLLKGSAGLRFERDDRLVELAEGDFINIPARERHRVEWTAADTECVWLAVFY